MPKTLPAGETLAAALERESSWLHGLARALTRDVEAASDAAQTTLLRAWEKAPRGEPPRRAWLARVLTNSLRENSRRAGMRREREEAAARVDRVDDERPLERLELQRRIIDAVDALPEPYRTTLVLRFFDGLSVRAIATRTREPAKTVYTRIERALARLRVQLDHHFGDDRSAWMSAVLALPPSGWNWVSVLEGAAMGTGIKLAAAAAVVVVGAAVLMRSDDMPAVDALRAGEAPRAEEHRVPVAGLETVGGGEARLAIAVPESVEATVDAATEPPPEVAAMVVPLRGLVLDVDGRPIPNVVVRAGRFEQGQGARATSDRAGRFELGWDGEALPMSLVVDDVHYATLREGYVTRRARRRRRTAASRSAGSSTANTGSWPTTRRRCSRSRPVRSPRERATSESRSPMG